MIKPNKSEEFADEWTTLSNDTPLPVKQIVNEQIQEHSAKLAEMFYSIMMADPEANVFLSNELVNQRLHGSMQRWLKELFSLEPRDPHEIYRHQCHVGEVHARIQIPFTLIMRGARLLRYAISGYLVESKLDRGDLVKATNYVSEMMELALGAMTDYYVVSVEKSARTDESYRMFALGQNMVAEREKQRAALMEWTQKILLGLLAGVKESEIPSLGKSSFGLWLQHKAAIVFESAPELEQMRVRIAEVERNIHLKVAESRKNPDNARVLMQEIESGIAAIKSLLGGLFDRYIEVDKGRDTLAHLLNRRYLPSVLKREMTMARGGNVHFALLLIDIDHFKAINVTHNHTVGDQVLQLASELIVAMCAPAISCSITRATRSWSCWSRSTRTRPCRWPRTSAPSLTKCRCRSKVENRSLSRSVSVSPPTTDTLTTRRSSRMQKARCTTPRKPAATAA